MIGTVPEITQRVEFECCYVESPNVLNAHRYRWEVTVQGPQQKYNSGKVIEFNSLKHCMMHIVPDNSFLYGKSKDESDNTGMKVARFLFDNNISVCNISDSVSAENILIYLIRCLQSELLIYSDITIKHSKLQETSHSWVEWHDPEFGIDMNNGSLYQI